MEKIKEIANKVSQVMADMIYDCDNDRLDNDKLDIYAYTLNYYSRKLTVIRRKREHDAKYNEEVE